MRNSNTQPDSRLLTRAAAGATITRIIPALTASVRRTFTAHIPLYAISMAFFIFSFLLLSVYHVPMPLGSGLFFLMVVGELLVLWVPILTAVDVWQFWRKGLQGRLTAYLLKTTAARFLEGDRIGNGVHALVALMPMIITFTVIKENITALNPFSWDKTFAQWDLVLGAGHMPWQILQPFLDYPVLTTTLNFFYHLWFFLMFGLLIWKGFAAQATQLRLQFLLAYCFAWFFGGSVLAIVFSSAGPCFYGDLFQGPNPFAEQMAYLNHIGPSWIWSLAVQRELWSSYATGSGTLKGISAMPSMHVTVAVVNALLCVRVNRRLGIAASVFAAAIFLGSIVLLWHYAVDGLAGVIIACLCWAAAGAIAQQWTAYVERRRTTNESVVIQST